MKFVHALFAAALAGTSLAAAAHGDTDRARKEGHPVRKEQTDWGIAGEARDARRTIEITMSDTMRFTPERLQVRQGETVRLVVRNAGKMLHELVLGTRKELEKHAALMVRFPNMEHDEPFMAHVGPGRKEQLVWNFNRAGEFDFACLVPGHYQAGMVGKILVVPGHGKADRGMK